MSSKIIWLLLALLLILSIGSLNIKRLIKQPASVFVQPTPKSNLANPASVNCENKGGKLIIKKRGDGGQYGICVFEDNRQCEEWTLFRGECQPGNFKITGYDNEAQIYCAITAGKVNMNDKTCTFRDGMVCDMDKYFAGQCLKNGLNDLIKVSEPMTESKITNPLIVKGEARGQWFFEASFPVKLLDGNGQVLAQGIARAQGDWMTTDWVPFTAQLKFSKPTTKSGSLILSKDNPSGLPANDDQIIISVIF
jgi:putative hemolysin